VQRGGVAVGPAVPIRRAVTVADRGAGVPVPGAVQRLLRRRGWRGGGGRKGGTDNRTGRRGGVGGDPGRTGWLARIILDGKAGRPSHEWRALIVTRGTWGKGGRKPRTRKGGRGGTAGSEWRSWGRPANKWRSGTREAATHGSGPMTCWRGGGATAWARRGRQGRRGGGWLLGRGRRGDGWGDAPANGRRGSRKDGGIG